MTAKPDKLIQDNVIPLLEAIGWRDLWCDEETGELFGTPPEEQRFGAWANQYPVPDEYILSFRKPEWYAWPGWTPRLRCLVERSNGQVCQAIFTMGGFETDDGQAITDVAGWLPYHVESVGVKRP